MRERDAKRGRRDEKVPSALPSSKPRKMGEASLREKTASRRQEVEKDGSGENTHMATFNNWVREIRGLLVPEEDTTFALVLRSFPKEWHGKKVDDFFRLRGVAPKRVDMPNRREGSTLVAFVHFADQTDLDKALALRTIKVKGRFVAMQPFESSKSKSAANDTTAPKRTLKEQASGGPPTKILAKPSITQTSPARDSESAPGVGGTSEVFGGDHGLHFLQTTSLRSKVATLRLLLDAKLGSDKISLSADKKASFGNVTWDIERRLKCFTEADFYNDDSHRKLMDNVSQVIDRYSLVLARVTFASSPESLDRKDLEECHNELGQVLGYPRRAPDGEPMDESPVPSFRSAGAALLAGKRRGRVTHKPSEEGMALSSSAVPIHTAAGALRLSKCGAQPAIRHIAVGLPSQRHFAVADPEPSTAESAPQGTRGRALLRAEATGVRRRSGQRVLRSPSPSARGRSAPPDVPLPDRGSQGADGASVSTHYEESEFVPPPMTPPVLPSPSTRYSGRFQRLTIRKIGSGGFGCLNEVRETDSGRHFALKTQRYAARGDAQTNLEACVREALIQSDNRHPNLIRTVAQFLDMDKKQHLSVSELCPGGNLYEFQNGFLAQGTSIPEDVVGTIAAQVIDGLTFIHTLVTPVVHNDVKHENILLVHRSTRRPWVKICDFGLARLLKPPLFLTRSSAGTPEFQSPEQAAGKLFGIKSDWWAFGVVLYSLHLSDRHPAAGTDSDVSTWTGRRGAQPRLSERDCYERLPKETKWLLSGLLQKRPEDRLDILAILQSRYYRKFSDKRRYPAAWTLQDFQSALDSGSREAQLTWERRVRTEVDILPHNFIPDIRLDSDTTPVFINPHVGCYAVACFRVLIVAIPVDWALLPAPCTLFGAALVHQHSFFLPCVARMRVQSIEPLLRCLEETKPRVGQPPYSVDRMECAGELLGDAVAALVATSSVPTQPSDEVPLREFADIYWKDLDRSSDKTMLRLFGGLQISERRCTGPSSCQSRKAVLSLVLQASLVGLEDEGGVLSFQATTKAFFSGDDAADVRCDTCGAVGSASSSSLYWRTPQILLILFGRSFFDSSKRRDGRPVECPRRLGRSLVQAWTHPHSPEFASPPAFRLVSMAEHLPDAAEPHNPSKGHVVGYVRARSEDGRDFWVRHDDHRRHAVSEPPYSNAYIAIYVKKSCK